MPGEVRDKWLRDPEKTKVIINGWAINRDPRYWKDAETFDPERFRDSTVDFKGTHFEYIPFGRGEKDVSRDELWPRERRVTAGDVVIPLRLGTSSRDEERGIGHDRVFRCDRTEEGQSPLDPEGLSSPAYGLISCGGSTKDEGDRKPLDMIHEVVSIQFTCQILVVT
ncbi:hypothetical protein MLD38_021118 [Melastoma candidum]|uniref:Uncharacterized protein n=1 Tax=Melastoma candidum TaxID=119954 RepID=A0ACB9QEZ2_9MYRT|nr:hypothetical protein MLD38_021118 [Melastoma candidum]